MYIHPRIAESLHIGSDRDSRQKMSVIVFVGRVELDF